MYITALCCICVLFFFYTSVDPHDLHSFPTRRSSDLLTGVPFGAPSTLAGCAAITDVLKGLRIKMCGYSGLMLPVLEDPVLARRASEGRFSVRDLLLYSSVCGTGPDVVPRSEERRVGAE